jgi:myosin heavy subunit
MVLVLGNVEFDSSSPAAPTPETESMLKAGAELAGVPVAKLLDALTHKTLRKTEKVACDPVIATRSFLMYIYSLAFEWVIERINNEFAFDEQASGTQASSQKARTCPEELCSRLVSL